MLQNSSDPWDAPVLTLGFGSLAVSLIAAGFCNYFYGKHFATTAIAFETPLLTLAVLLVGRFDEHWDVIPFASNFVGGQVLIAAYLVLLVIILTATVALAASTRFGTLMTLMICTCFLGLGLITDYAFGQYEEASALAGVAYRVVPNIGPFWIVDGLFAETQETAVPFRYVGYATCYAALLTTGILSLAIFAFQKREVG